MATMCVGGNNDDGDAWVCSVFAIAISAPCYINKLIKKKRNKQTNKINCSYLE